jgi:hypothetical protein
MSTISKYFTEGVTLTQGVKDHFVHKLCLNFYGIVIDLNFVNQDDLKHYQYYFDYFQTSTVCLDNKLDTYWVSSNGYQSFCKTLENPKFLKEIYVKQEDRWFLYDRFSSKPKQPSLIPPLHLSPLHDEYIGLHGAAISLNGKSLLIFGKNNSGKSTYSINLVLTGFKFLSDDTVVYHSKSNKIYAFPRPIGIREGTLQGSQEILSLLKGKTLVRYKCQDYTHLMVAPKELVSDCIVPSADPHIAIFLHNVPGQREISITQISTDTLFSLLSHCAYYFDKQNPDQISIVQGLAHSISKGYVMSLDISLSNIRQLVDIAHDLLKTGRGV